MNTFLFFWGNVLKMYNLKHKSGQIVSSKFLLFLVRLIYSRNAIESGNWLKKKNKIY